MKENVLCTNCCEGSQAEQKNKIIFCSKEMKSTVLLAQKLAKTDITVLIQGESGTGKEVIANLIYQLSDRNQKPFMKVNCGAIPENLLESELFGYEKGAFTGASEKGKPGIFEMADKGTIFLDEIGAMSAAMQAKLLRVIQEHEVMHVGGIGYMPIDVRIIAAANVNLKTAVDRGEFRLDLYYRLNVVPIVIEPLRIRKMDIYPLSQHFLSVFNRKYNCDKIITEKGWHSIYKYNWPGNVRELENMIERLVVMTEGRIIDESHIANQFNDFDIDDAFEDRMTTDLKIKVEAYEKKLISSQMRYYKRSGELAEALGIDKSTLTRKIKKYGIKSQYSD